MRFLLLCRYVQNCPNWFKTVHKYLACLCPNGNISKSFIQDFQINPWQIFATKYVAEESFEKAFCTAVLIFCSPSNKPTVSSSEFSPHLKRFSKYKAETKNYLDY